MIDAYLARLEQQLDVPRRRRLRIVDEVRDHLDDAVAQLLTDGLSRAMAEQRAVESFGSADAVAAECNRDVAVISMRRMPLLMSCCGMLVTCGFLAATIPQPTAEPSPVPLLRQITFFVGMLGIQFAVVAGVRCAARVAATWTRGPNSDDVRLLRRTALVFLAGLVSAVASWGAALLHVNHVRGDVRALPLTAGLIAMAIGAVVAAAMTMHRQHRDLPPGDDDEMSAGWPAAGERLIAWSGTHPLLSCSLVAAITGLTAMRHAETTVTGALPWGVAQAAAVVAGYLAVGPALELRT